MAGSLHRARRLQRPAYLVAEGVQTPHIAGHGEVAEGSLQHPQGLQGPAARLLNDPRGFNHARMRESDRRVIGFFQRHLLTNASRTGA